MNARPAVFLDRDGTVNVEKHYLHRYEDWEWIPGAEEAIRAFNRAGLLVVIVTNQAGVARGLYTEADVSSLHRRVAEELARSGARVDGWYHCPHHPDFGDRIACACRKPAPGMLLRAAQDLGIDLARSFLVGDRESDVQAALACGVTPLLVATGYGEVSRRACPEGIPFVPSLRDAAERVLSAVSAVVVSRVDIERMT